MSKQGYQLTGKFVEGYKISKPIGQGKFSIVYKAQNEQGIPYALKKIKIFDMADQKQRQKCLKEVDLMKPLNHPNIIQYVDSLIYNNELIIVTEWADKGDLKKLIREHEQDQINFQEPVIWRYMKEISGALMHMHQKRIMHRDLKPANIFIGHDYTLKIGDLGLGRSFSSETLQAYSKVGTPLYMSPQLIQDSGYNQNADVWSLGCIIYQLCELNSPFRNKKQKMSLMDLFDNITKCNYKPISSRYSPQLSQAIKHMIVVDPSKRWSSQQVYNLSSKVLEDVKKPRLDPIITMDDIHIKLNLLNYKIFFCNVAEKPPISKFYFAIKDEKDNQNQQLYYFLELCYWAMSLSKPNQKKEKLALYTKTLIDWKSPENACIKFLADLNNFGVKTQDIEMSNILEGYGQAVCYLLNQVLNRELIRCNFQFQKPDQTEKSDLNDKVPSPQKDQLPDQGQLSDPQRNIEEQSFQEQSQLQQSIFFNKNQRKQKHIGGQLLEKIQQFDNDQEDKTIIWGRADQKQWRIQCQRLGKKFTQITQNAKQLKKKHGYQHFETAKICTAKLTDLIHYVKPASTLLLKKIDDELQVIKLGEKSINQAHKSIGQQFQDANQQFKQLSTRQSILSNSIKQRFSQLQKIEERLEQVNLKIQTASSQSEDSNKGNIKVAIQVLKKEVIQLDQKKGIILWELTKCKLIATRKEEKQLGLPNNLQFQEL